MGTKANVVGFKLWYSGSSRSRNGVGILVDRELREQVVENRRVNERMTTVKLVVGGLTFNIISAHGAQTGFVRGCERHPVHREAILRRRF